MSDCHIVQRGSLRLHGFLYCGAAKHSGDGLNQRARREFRIGSPPCVIEINDQFGRDGALVIHEQMIDRSHEVAGDTG